MSAAGDILTLDRGRGRAALRDGQRGRAGRCRHGARRRALDGALGAYLHRFDEGSPRLIFQAAPKLDAWEA